MMHKSQDIRKMKEDLQACIWEEKYRVYVKDRY